MTHDQLLHELLAERFGTPVREYKPQGRSAPIATQLDDLILTQAVPALTVLPEAG